MIKYFFISLCFFPTLSWAAIYEVATFDRDNSCESATRRVVSYLSPDRVIQSSCEKVGSVFKVRVLADKFNLNRSEISFGADLRARIFNKYSEWYKNVEDCKKNMANVDSVFQSFAVKDYTIMTCESSYESGVGYPAVLKLFFEAFPEVRQVRFRTHFLDSLSEWTQLAGKSGIRVLFSNTSEDWKIVEGIAVAQDYTSTSWTEGEFQSAQNCETEKNLIAKSLPEGSYDLLACKTLIDQQSLLVGGRLIKANFHINKWFAEDNTLEKYKDYSACDQDRSRILKIYSEKNPGQPAPYTTVCSASGMQLILPGTEH